MSLAAALLPGRRRSDLADSAALSALVRDCVATDQPRQVLLLRLGPLTRQAPPGHRQRLVQATLEPLLRPSRARLFVLANGDLAAAGPAQGLHLEAVARRLETLLEGEAIRPAWALLRLPDHAAQVLAAVEEALAAPDPPADPAPSAAPGGISRLARVVATANLDSFLRCRPVMRLDPTEAEALPVPHWTEWRLALPELCAAILGDPGAAAAAADSPWLRGVLEQRLLAALAVPEEAARRGPIGLTLGLAAIDSAAFRRLEAAMAPELRAGSVIALPAATALADALGFRAARQGLAARGWRVALDAPHPAALRLLPPVRLGLDHVRLRYNPALAAAGLPPGLAPEQVVLAGVHRPAALGWGMEAGIRLFEGRLLAR